MNLINPDCDECFGNGYITLWPYAREPWNHKSITVPCPVCNRLESDAKKLVSFPVM